MTSLLRVYRKHEILIGVDGRASLKYTGVAIPLLRPLMKPGEICG